MVKHLQAEVISSLPTARHFRSWAMIIIITGTNGSLARIYNGIKLN